MDMLFRERNNMLVEKVRTDKIDRDMYALLINVCDKYISYMANKFPEYCPDYGNVVCGLDLASFEKSLKFQIPGLFYGYDGKVVYPSVDDYDQYALLDYIEYIGGNIKDITEYDYHTFFQHHHLKLENTEQVFVSFQNEVNEVFELTGLLYTLADSKRVERITTADTQIDESKEIVQTIKEPGLKDLINEAVSFYKHPNPAIYRSAVEKLWDALERVKTFYVPAGMDKKKSVETLIKSMANNQQHFFDLFTTEFRTLTEIGNNYRIRHHETDKYDISDDNYYEYFFNRCFALIVLAIKYI